MLYLKFLCAALSVGAILLAALAVRLKRDTDAR